MDKDTPVDILSIHNEIIKNFNEEQKLIDNFINYRSRLLNILENYNISLKIKNDLKNQIEFLNQKIEDISNKDSYNFFLLETSSVIERYKNLICKPMKISFSGKNDSTLFKEKDELIKEYFTIIKNFNLNNIPTYTDKKKKNNTEIQCENCNNKSCIELLDNKIFVCDDCGFQKEILGNISSYKDVNRVNLSSKYTYERRVHFRDCINQYQGKQNSTISEKVYTDLEDQFQAHHLLEGDKSTPREERFKNITKDHILLFLKETGHTKHYEDVFLIFYKMTGKKPDDISYLENKLMEDFEILSNLYDKKFKQDKSKKIDRKSFINIQYVLYQLLRKYKHPCKKEDFNILKTLDRKSFHDDIMKELFEELGWNFFSPQF
jgi:ribosomal protein L37AE/L43A